MESVRPDQEGPMSLGQPEEMRGRWNVGRAGAWMRVVGMGLVWLIGGSAVAAWGGTGSEGVGARDSTGCAELVLRVVDEETGEPLQARCCVTGCEGTPCFPCPAERFLCREAYGNFPACFFSSGVCTLQVPIGAVSVAVSRGFEYGNLLDTLTVFRDTTVVCTLSRWIDMADEGWFSGDCHTHADHSGGVYDVYPEDVRFVAECEGLNVVNCLDGGHCFTGGPDPCSTSDQIVYVSQEKRSRVYGHTGLLGIASIVPPLSYTTWWPLIMDVADEVHAQPGALAVCAHPMSTADIYDIDSVAGMMLARELPIDVIGGKVDAYEVLSREGATHRRNVEMWYRILNCGFRLPGCAGTDGCIDANYGRPIGSYRSYVEIAGEFGYYSWLDGLASGRTFVTNGPLFTEFSIDGLSMGDSVDISGADTAEVSGSISVACSSPLLRVDIVVSGDVDQTLFPSRDGTSSS